MSEELKSGAPDAPAPGSAPAPQDELKNFKAEMNRKLENTNSQLAALLGELKKGSAPAAAPEGKKISVWDDEEGYARNIAEQAEKRIEAKLQSQKVQEQKVQSTVQSILNDYPEAADNSSDLVKRANEIFATLPDDDKASPLAMRASVTSAAAELGLRPKSKRSASGNDSFALGGSSPKSAQNNKDDMDQRTHDFAVLMGRDPAKVKKYIRK